MLVDLVKCFECQVPITWLKSEQWWVSKSDGKHRAEDGHVHRVTKDGR
jgi:hypothetical protein